MSEKVFNYNSIEDATRAYDGFVNELETSINDYQVKTAGIAGNGEVWGGTAAGIANHIIEEVRGYIKELRTVTEDDNTNIKATSNDMSETETAIINTYGGNNVG